MVERQFLDLGSLNVLVIDEVLEKKFYFSLASWHMLSGLLVKVVMPLSNILIGLQPPNQLVKH